VETTVDQIAFREAMSRFASGVTICTTKAADGAYVGFTASSFCSLSLEPPLLLVCLQKNADCYAAFMESNHFAVSILSHGQDEIAVRFATKAIDKWDQTPDQPAPLTGLPVVTGASATCECRIYDRVDGGDHTILLGEVLRADTTDAPPLLHYARQFGRFVSEEPGL
jgi:flavin reductase ActVB